MTDGALSLKELSSIHCIVGSPFMCVLQMLKTKYVPGTRYLVVVFFVFRCTRTRRLHGIVHRFALSFS